MRDVDISPTSRCALKCKYCGQETTIIEFDHGDWICGVYHYDDWCELNEFMEAHSHCSERDSAADPQPFLLSWS